MPSQNLALILFSKQSFSVYVQVFDQNFVQSADFSALIHAAIIFFVCNTQLHLGRPDHILSEITWPGLNLLFFLPNTTEWCDDSLYLALEIMRHMNTWWLWLHFCFYHSSHLQKISHKHVNIYNILLWNTAMDHMAEIRIMPSNKYSTILSVQQLHHFYSESYSSTFIKALTPKNPVIPATKAKHSKLKSWNQDIKPKPQ